MKKLTRLTMAAIVFCGMLATANGIVINNDILFGTADPATPSNPGDEESRLELLIKAHNNNAPYLVEANYSNINQNVQNTYDGVASGKVLTLNNNGGIDMMLTDVVTHEFKNQDEGENFTHNLMGMTYEWLAIKQKTVTSYYYIGDVQDDVLVYNDPWSHYSLFNKTGTSVPDSGSTLALLGLAISAFAFARRKMKA